LKGKPNKLKQTITTLTYPITASMARRRFWMLNSLFPKSPSGKGLRTAINKAVLEDKKIIDLGCGDTAQALVDLRNEGIDNLYGIDLKPPKKVKGIEITKGSMTQMPYPDEFIDGVLFSSYVLPHLSSEDQYKVLEEIDRISGPGSIGFIGPINPQANNLVYFKEKFPGFKNPYWAYVQEKNKQGKGKWVLSRSMLFNLAVYTKPNKVQGFIYKQRIPFYMLYFLTGRGLLNRITPSFKVRKDFQAKMPFEYFITFEK
jgi:hypothetical protein